MPAAVLVGAAGWAFNATLVEIPLISQAVPARLLFSVVAVVVAITPLYSAFPELEGTWSRERPLRLARVLACSGLASFAMVPTWLWGAAADRAVVALEMRVMLLLLAIGLVLVVVAGELAGVLAAAVGLLSIVADYGSDRVVSNAVETTPGPAVLAAVVLGATVLAVRGPSIRT